MYGGDQGLPFAGSGNAGPQCEMLEAAHIRGPHGHELPIRRFPRTIPAKPTGADQCQMQRGYPRAGEWP